MNVQVALGKSLDSFTDIYIFNLFVQRQGECTGFWRYGPALLLLPLKEHHIHECQKMEQVLPPLQGQGTKVAQKWMEGWGCL